MLIATQNFLVPGPTFVVELAIFLIVLGVLAKWVLPYVNRAMEDRQETISRSLSDADDSRKRAEALEQEYQKALEQARADAQQLKDEAARLGEQLREQLHQKGQEEYNRLLARATVDIEAAVRRATEELRGQLSALVMTVVERVLGEGISLADQSQLIDRAIGEVESMAQARPGALSGGPIGSGVGG